MLRSLSLLALTALLGGCASASVGNYQTAAAVGEGGGTEYDRHLGKCVVFTPPIRDYGAMGLLGAPREWWLRASYFDAAGGDWDYSLRFGTVAEEWRFYKSAWTEGRPLSMVSVVEENRGCGQYSCHVAELVDIGLTRDDLERFAHAGADIKIVGSVSEVVSIPAHFVEGLLSQADARSLGDAATRCGG